MENSYDTTKWSNDFTTSPSMLSCSLQSDSDWNRYDLGFSSSSSGNFPVDDFVGGVEKGESLSRSHRMAEKRRRDRINSHLNALRKLVPDSNKLDKAALLARVIEQVKELKQKATESSSSSSPIFQHLLPSETDEVTVTPQQNNEPNTTIFKASFCCQDQPEAISEIIKVLTKLQLETLHAEIICIGGRMRIDFVLKDNNNLKKTSSSSSAKVLKQSLCGALNRITSSSSSSTTSSICRIRSKRQRWFLSSHYSQ